MSTKKLKTDLRKVMLEKRNELSQQERHLLSTNICAQLWSYISANKCEVIHSYLPMGSEVNLLPLVKKALDKGLTVVVPKSLKKRQMQNLILTDLKNMEPGIFNTYHPKNAEEYMDEYDLIIVAGLAFNKRGDRVGYGGGYYDTFLAEQPNAQKIGVCYPFQMMTAIPTEAHDIQMDMMIS